VRESLTVSVNGGSVEFEVVYAPETDSYRLGFVAPLRPERESVIEFRMTESWNGVRSVSPLAHNRQLGLCLIGFSIELATAENAHEWSEVDLALRDRALVQRDEAASALATVLTSRTWRYSAGIRALRRRVVRERRAPR
jgi:hypothetical protein